MNDVFRVALVCAEANQARLAGGSPFEPIQMALTAAETIENVNLTSGYRTSIDDLDAMFVLEPPCWNFHLDRSRDHWTTSGAILRPFGGMTSNEQYLSILQEVMVSQEPVRPVEILPPMAVPEAFDHLDFAWRLVMNSPLIGTKRLARGALLTQPVNSADEFDSHCSALKNILDQMQVMRPAINAAKGWKSMASLQYHLPSGRVVAPVAAFGGHVQKQRRS